MNGFVNVSGLRPILNPIKQRLEKLLQGVFPEENVDIKGSEFGATINQLYLSDHDKLMSIYKVLDRTPEMISAPFSPEVYGAVKSVGLKAPVLSSYPTWRLDLYNNRKNRWFPWHQENYHESFSANGVTLWAPLHKVGESESAQSMYIKPGSHKFGTLVLGKNKFDVVDERVKGIKEECVELEYGEGIIFNNYVLHKSGIIQRENAVRLTVQFRFDDLEDTEYKNSGWPQNYKIEDSVDTEKYPDLPH